MKEKYIKPMVTIHSVLFENMLALSNFERTESRTDIEVNDDYYLDPSNAMGKERGNGFYEEFPDETYGNLWN